MTKFLTNNCDPERKEKCLRAFCNASLFEEEYKIKITEEGILEISHEQNKKDDETKAAPVFKASLDPKKILQIMKIFFILLFIIENA